MSTYAPAVEPDEAAATDQPADPQDGEQSTPETLTPAEAKALRAELRAEKRAREAAEKLADERKATKEFWERRGQVLEQAPRHAPPAPPADPLEELDLLTLLTEEKDPARIKTTFNKIVKAQIAAELQRGNYVSRQEAEGYVAQMVNSASAFNQLLTDFPGLKDPKGEFFAETQKQLAALGNDPAMYGAPQGVLERMAAQQAEIALTRAGKTQLATDPEEERYERVARQRGGSRGRGQVADEVTLSLAEKDMARKLGIDEKRYLARKREMAQPGAVGPALTADRMMRELG